MVDQHRHEVGREDVERVAFVSVGNEEPEPPVEVVLEREAPGAGECRGPAREETAVLRPVEHEVRQGCFEFEREVGPPGGGALLARAGRVLGDAGIDVTPRLGAEPVHDAIDRIVLVQEARQPPHGASGRVPIAVRLGDALDSESAVERPVDDRPVRGEEPADDDEDPHDRPEAERRERVEADHAQQDPEAEHRASPGRSG
ncbi:hypothetical protein FLP10_02170 [Agromyces intestinalis]|uniref:Uncharacterized protein n=1 Tax=Agromyces intestinalis TaxID=2592652 RepID=A0A5C1YEZ1_9MICO|nr:hypothetical protein [Agromyces intestinalis]QEO13352.1 hypothetical protein FLP10_02170 [Agromyces intestinalis]